jgi:Spy/CpxP family protein refolding chaperone
MSIRKKSVTAALTVLVLGTAALATSSAEASPHHGGGRHGGWHGNHGG